MITADEAATPAAADGFCLSGTMPLYGYPRAITTATHRDHAILPGPDDFSFAARTALVPVPVDEFAAASLDYPIVLFGPERRTFVVTGLNAERNLFVDADGNYAAGAYIPAYLHRYPFAFARDSEDRLQILCLDQASPHVGTTADEDARPLFDGDQLAEITNQALAFCQKMEADETRTATLVTVLDDHGLLQGRQAQQTVDGASTLLLDYATIDPAKLEGLADEQFCEIRRTGALAAIHAQILSTGNWSKLQVRSEQAA